MTDERPVIVVTGVSGLIGSAVVDDLSHDYRMVGLDIREPAKELAACIDYIQCDLTSDASTSRAFDVVANRCGRNIASVIHLAEYRDSSGEPSPMYQKLTVDGTSRVVRRLRDFDVEQILFSSSLLVMKPSETGIVITELSPTEAVWDYPQSKRDAERVLLSDRGPIPAVILRIAGVYDDDCHSIPIAHQIQRIYEKAFESHFFPGNRSHGQSFLHAEDLVRCVRRAVERRHQLSELEIFLIGEPDVMSYGELQDAIGKMLHGKEWTTVRIPKPIVKAGAWVKDKLTEEDALVEPRMVDLSDAHYPISIGMAKQKLGWAPRHSLRAVLPRMIERLMIDPRRWYRENDLTWTDALEAELSALRHPR